MDVKAGYKQTEVGVIPEEWEVAAVRQKGEVLTGKALAVNAPGPQRPYLRTKNVFDGRIDLDDVLTMPMTDEQFAQFRIRNGDVLLNEGQSIELVGRCAMYQDEYPEPCAIQNALLRFRAGAGVSEKFASYLFRHCQHTGVFARIALQTTSVAHLGGSRFERLRLAWPTEPEQRAIATALSDVDGLLGGLDRLIAKKRDLKQAAMQQLLTGQTRLSGFMVKSGYQKTDVGIIPEDWEVKGLAAIADKIMVGIASAATHAYRAKGIPMFRNQNIKVGHLDDGDLLFIAPEYEVLFKNKRLRGGDLLTMRTGYPGVTAIVPLQYESAQSFTTLITRPRQHEAESSYLCHYINSEMGQRFFTQSQIGGAQKNVNAGTLRHMPVPLPKVPEQIAIAEVLTEMDLELAGLQQRREKTRALKQAMMQELLTGRTRLV